MAESNFERALACVLRHEGGYGDHPADPGGATNFGVTRATLAHHRGRPVTKAEVRALTRAEAAGIYRQRYWGRSEATICRPASTFSSSTSPSTLGRPGP